MPDSSKICIVILAAGGSSRMGKAKQLLPVGDELLLQKAVNAAQNISPASGANGPPSASASPTDTAATNNIESAKFSVYVVLGCESETIKKQISFERCHVLVNENWQSGMSSSIVLAIKAIEKNDPQASAVVLMMGDQPWVKGDTLAKLVAKFNEGNVKIVVSSFAAKGTDEKIPGPPALFARDLFPELMLLEGDVGARAVVQAHSDSMTAVEFPLGAIDIDTETDYVSLLAAL